MRPTYILVALALLGLVFTACPRKPPEVAMPAPSSTKPINPGETVRVQFVPDGHWHSSGFVARPGDRLRFRPVGESAFLGRKAVLVHIGRTVAQIAFSTDVQMVTQTGEIAFRSNPTELGPYTGNTIDLDIQNLRKAGE